LADAMGIGGLQDQVKETTAKEALGAMTSPLSEFGFNPEELAAQEAQIIRQAAEAKAKAMQQMAGRGLGGSGLELAGLGNIDVGAISAMTDLQTENKALQIEQRLNEIKTYLSAYGSQLDDETRKELAAEAADLQKEMFEYDKTSQAESDRHTLLNNLIAQVGGEKWAPETLAKAYEMLDAGMPYTDVIRAIVPDSNKKLLLAAADADASETDDGISDIYGNDATEGADYVEPEVVVWHSASQAEREAAYDEYASAAVNAGKVPLGEEDWNLWQQMAYDAAQEKEDEKAANE
jgi:hypothetical protein